MAISNEDLPATIFICDRYFRQKLIAINAQTGALKWSYTFPDRIATNVVYAKGNVYVGCYNKKFYCLDTSGNFKWSTTVIGLSGYANDPVPAGDVICIKLDYEILALKANNGTVAWKHNSVNSNFVSKVSLVNNLIFYSLDEVLYGVDPNTGALRWSRPHQGQNVFPTTNVVYFLSGSDTLSAFTFPNGPIKWKTGLSPFDIQAFKIHAGNIYCSIGFGPEDIEVYDSATGNFKFSFKNTVPFNNEPILTGDLFIYPGTYKIEIRKASTGIYESSIGYTGNIGSPVGIGGATLVNSDLYYCTKEWDSIMQQGASRYVATVARYNLNKPFTLKWATNFDNMDFALSTPCIVTNDGVCYIGDKKYK